MTGEGRREYVCAMPTAYANLNPGLVLNLTFHSSSVRTVVRSFFRLLTNL